ncbi:membrane protein of unknown function [Petrocella atlantisensis]|uniref:Uncharacterized protein n=1 Tax=Petrocella atlantisensis TaxID=2173034 RepID=A0A3P7Q0N9_9FIRM|nr:hypothetical protein [Petrocella atlantisensis]VDN49297.1 membrane protein of unknown function [Petrocella atlantisensis]
MKALGNVLLLPFKLILLIGFIISLVGFVLTTVFEHLSTFIVGTFISLCLLIIAASIVLYGTNLKENPASMMVLIAFAISVVITLIPFAFKGLLSFFKKGLAFWF